MLTIGKDDDDNDDDGEKKTEKIQKSCREYHLFSIILKVIWIVVVNINSVIKFDCELVNIIQ